MVASASAAAAVRLELFSRDGDQRQRFIHRMPRARKRAGARGERHATLCPICHQLVPLRGQLRPASPCAPTRPRCGAASSHALLAKRPHICRQRRNQWEAKHAVWRASIDLHPGQDLEAAPAWQGVLADLDQVLHAAPSAVELPHHQAIPSATRPQGCGCNFPDWPSRSNEQIFYGKQGNPLAPKEHKMPYQAKKQCVA